jgi:endogenous inhibitor of DNA gyrase (YacG/DUF329 family)
MPKLITPNELYRRQNWSKICKTCGNSFGWKKNGDKAIYCSNVCSGKANGSISTNKNKLNLYKCFECGKDFNSYHKNRKFCNKECANIAWSKDMPRGYACKKDANHNEVVNAMQKVGAYVLDMSHVGRGFPDLIVGFQSKTILMEIKNPSTAYGKKGLNKNQLKWKEEWTGGTYCVVDSPEAALRMIGVLK